MALLGRSLLIGIMILLSLGLPAPGTAAASVAPFTLALTATAGGSAAATPQSPTYGAGTIVTIDASPAAGHLFVGWVIDGVAAGWATPRKLVMDADHTVVATFAPVEAFTDLPASGAESEAIRQMNIRGVIKGYTPAGCAARGLGSPCFGPTDSVLRGEIAAMVVRALGWDGLAPADAAPFSDLASIDPELQRAIAILAERGVMQGYGDGRAGPTDPVLRIQIISLITRAMIEAGYWAAATADDPALYPNIPASSVHRLDLVTFTRNAGPIPGRPQNQPWDDWLDPAPRAWTARALWQALDAYFTSGPFNPDPDNNPPVATAESYTTDEDTPLNQTTPGVLGNDSDPNADTLTATLVAGPAHAASFALAADGSFAYAPATNYTGSDSFSYQARDPNGALSAVTTATIAVSPVNDAPVNTVPGPQAAAANTPLVFTAAGANAIAIADVDAGASPAQVTLTATNGTLTLAATVGLAFTDGDGADDAAMSFIGALDAINAALNGLNFTPGTNYLGAASVQITSDDLGNTGAGSALGDTDTVAIAVNAGPATTIALESETGSSAVGGARTLQVKVTDGTGAPVQGYTVAWATGPSSGSVSAPTSVTDASGTAGITWTLGTQAGPQSTTAMATGLTGSPVTFTITAMAGAAAQLGVATQPSAAAQSGVAFVLQPAVRLQDSFGNPVAQAGVTVTAGIATGGGTLGGTATANTDASGVATFTDLAITGTVGSRTLSFSAAGLTGTTSASISITAGAAAQLGIVTQPSATAQAGVAFGQQPIIQVEDASGNPVAQPGVTVTADIASGGGALGGTATATTGADGRAVFTALSITGTIGPRTLSFSAAGLTGATSGVIDVTAGAAAQLGITTQPSATAQAGVAFGQQPVAQLQDGFGNPVAQAGVTVTAAIASGGGTLGGTATATTDAAGAAVFTDLSIGGTVGNRTLSFAASGLTGATSSAINVTAGPATQLTLTIQPSATAQSGVAFGQQPAVQLRDGFGNPVAQAGVTVTAAIASGGGALGGTATATTDASGVATFTDLSIAGTVGNRTLSFAATGLTGATSNTIILTAGAPAQLAIVTQPSATAQNGATFDQQPVIQLQDIGGNPVAQAGITVTVAIASGGTLGGTTTAMTDPNGQATFTNLSITGTIGDYTLTFSASGLTNATSDTIAIIAGAPAQLGIVTQPSATAQAGVAFAQQPVIEVQDASGNAVTQAGMVVTAAIASGGGTLGGILTATTGVSGQATFTDLSIGGTVGDRTLSFASGGLTGATSGTITLTAGPAAALAFSVQPSDAVASAPIAPAIEVGIVDAYGNAVTGATGSVTVAIGANPSGGTLSGTTTVTAASGVATFSDLSINLVGTGYTLAASSGALTGATSAAFNVTHGPLHHFLVEAAGGGPIGIQIAGTPFNVRITAQDEYNNTVTSFTGTVGFTSTPAGGISAGATSGAFTAGELSSHALTFGTPGSFTLTATNTAGAQNGTSNSFDVQAPPTALSDEPDADSAPGEPYHGYINQAFSLPAPGLLTNDNLGFPIATITSFGGGSVGGLVTTHPAGGTVSLAIPSFPGGALTVRADGSVTLTPPTDFTGLVTFQYRLTNALNTSDATVTIAVGARPTAVNDTYSPALVGNVPINTATSSQFNVTGNDQGDRITSVLVGATNGIATVDASGTFTFAPDAGYEGDASFTYTVTNGFGTSAPATVSLTVTNVVWFVQVGAASGGDGRFGTPFNCLTGPGCFGSTALDGADDRIFLSSGAYTGGLTLLGGQRLIGQGASGSFGDSANLNVAWPADAGAAPTLGGTAPTITTAAASTNGVNLGSGNALRGFNLGNATGAALFGNSFGTLTISEVGINTTGQALGLTTGTLSGGFPQIRSTGGVNNILLASVATAAPVALGAAADELSGATGDAFKIDGGSGSFTYAGAIANATHSPATLAVNITNKNGGTVALTGTINAGTAASGIAVANNTGSTAVTFSGNAKKLSTGTGTGASISGNGSGVTVAFTGGGLTIATTSGNGFNATGGGTVTMEGAGNTIASGSGVALNVANTTIGAGGLTFQSIAANGGANGIVLNNTGATAGLTVTGNGGSCTVATPTCTGGTIQNTTGDAIVLDNTRNVSLAFTRILNAGRQGIWGKTVSGFSLTNSLNIGAGDGDEENGILFENDATTSTVNHTGTALNGTFLIRDVVIDTPTQWGLRVHQNSGALNMTLQRLTVQNNYPATFGEHAVSINVEGSGTANVLVDDADFLTVNAGLHGNTQGTGGAVLNLTVQNTVVNQSEALPFGFNFTTSGTATGRFKATGNTLTGCTGAVPTTMCSLGIDLDASINSTLEAIITNNTISSTGIGGGIEFIVNENAFGRAEVRDNVVTLAQPDKVGFNFHARNVPESSGQTGQLHLTLEGNTVNSLSSTAAVSAGFQLLAGSSSGTGATHPNTVCVNLATAHGAGGNIVNGTNSDLSYGFILRMRLSSTFQLQGYTGSASDTGAIASFVQSNNPGGSFAGETFVGTGSNHALTYTGATCQTPTTPTLPPAAAAPSTVVALGAAAVVEGALGPGTARYAARVEQLAGRREDEGDLA